MKTSPFASPIARHIWETRYRLRHVEGVEETAVEDTWRRVARAVASAEKAGQAAWEQRFYQILEDFRFLPGGRILAGAGSGRRVTLFNCFVMGAIEDRMESIFEGMKEGALTMQAGGGVGYDFSTLRPEGSRARATGGIASGPVSFMRIWDAMCATLISTGSRRGAMIASLRCDHPDIERFIDAKRKQGVLSHFNLSVQVTDDFLDAVRRDADWPLVFPAHGIEQGGISGGETISRSWCGGPDPISCLVFRRIPARTLWDRLMRAAYETGEPGVLFVDRINRLNNLGYREYISTTNPCGEIPLPPYGACNLGSINLSAFVDKPFSGDARIDQDGIARTTAVAVRLLDDVIDLSGFPLEMQAAQARGTRRIGLGLTGLADALIMLGLDYSGEDARRTAAQILKTICHAAYRASIELAREKGSFPFFSADDYLRGGFIRTLPMDIREGIASHGIRNSHLIAIAPAGTISLFAGNISSGIEPVFEARYSRRILGREERYERFELVDFACRRWDELGREGLPPEFVSAHSVSPQAQLEMQAALQPFVDNAISKTVNVPETLPFEDFRMVYEAADQYGLKGCTTFRPNPVTGEILTAIQSSGVEQELVESHCCSLEREGD